MPRLRGKELIDRIQPPLIQFDDLTNLLKNLGPPEDRTRQRSVRCTEFGERLYHIANEAGLGERARLQKLAAEMASLLSKACLGSSDSSLYYAAQYSCPLTADKVRIGGLYSSSTAYPMAVVARISESRGRQHLQTYCLTVRLLRMAAWLVDGDPRVIKVDQKEKWQVATHQCGKKECLSLKCLRWGFHEDNLNEAYMHEYKRERSDPEFQPRR